MRGVASALYSALVYAAFVLSLLYLIGFVEGVAAPKTIDSGPAGALLPSLAIDLGLLLLFAAPHSIMARGAFKRAWTRVVPEEAERSTYVLVASATVALVCWQWRPLPAPVWTIANPVAAGALVALSWAGWGLTLLSSFLIDHFQLFGLTQGFSRLLRTPPAAGPAFATPAVYRWIRHPLYTGFILAFWAAPKMSLGHLVFAGSLTGYILVAIWFEERDLVAQFGSRYLRYRERTGMLAPRLRPGKAAREARAR